MGLNWYSDEKFPKRYTYPKNSLVGNNECHLEEQFGKSKVFWVYVEFKFLKSRICHVLVRSL